MDKNLLDIEDLFRTRLEDDAEIPTENTWDRIDKILDKDKIISIGKKYSYLKKVTFLLTLILIGLCVYIWNIRGNNNLADKNISIKTKDNKNILIPELSNNIDLIKPANSIKTTAANSQTMVKEITRKKIDKNILKNQPKKILLTPSNRKSISNLSVSKEIPKSEENIKQCIVKNLLNSSGSKQKKWEKNKSKKEYNKTMPSYNEEVMNAVGKHGDIDSNKTLLGLIKLRSLPVTEAKGSTTDLIEAKKMLTTAIFAETNALINKSESILKNKFITLKKPSPFSITGFYSYDISFFHLQNNHTDNQNTNAIDIENNETETFTYNVGVLIDYKPTLHWSLQSGLALATTNIAINPKTIYAETDNTGSVKYQINASSGYGYFLPSFSNNPNVGDSIFSISTANTLQYLGIPLAAKYSRTKGKFSINTMAGLSANFLTQGKITTEVELGNNKEIETVNKIYGLKKFYLSGIAGVGLDYDFYKNLSVSFSPTLRFALSAINKNVSVISYPNSLGFALGLKMKL